jgi:hypothetical protein
VNRSGNPEDADKAIREVRELTAKAGEMLDLMAARPNIISASLPEVLTAWDAMDRAVLALCRYTDDGDEQAAIFRRAFGRAADEVIGLAVDELWPPTGTGDDG